MHTARYASTPPERIELEQVVVRRESVEDAPAVAAAIASNISRLAPWMEWAVDAATDVESQKRRIADVGAQWTLGSAYDYLITDPTDVVLGKVGLHRRGNDAIEIGYWLTYSAEGRGLMTEICSVLTETAIGLDGIRRIEISCDADNSRSRAVPEKVGYRLDRVDGHPITTSHQTGRQMVWIYDAER